LRFGKEKKQSHSKLLPRVLSPQPLAAIEWFDHHPAKDGGTAVLPAQGVHVVVLRLSLLLFLPDTQSIFAAVAVVGGRGRYSLLVQRRAARFADLSEWNFGH
jgi:hypothetical protein